MSSQGLAEAKPDVRVLLLEDDAESAEFLRENLLAGDGPLHFQVEWADRLKGALDRIAQGGIDVILSDLGLPDSQGLETFVRLHARTPETPIVILTGTYEDERNALEAIRRGAQDYLVKGEADGRTIARSLLYAVERRQAEEKLQEAYRKLQAAQAQLIQSEKLAALGRFSAGLAHEVKNPLGIILSAIEFLEKKVVSGDRDVHECLRMLKASALRTDRIVQGLLRFARPSQLNLEAVSPQELIQNVLNLLRYRFPLKGIEVHTQFEQGLKVRVDRNQLEQALFNVVINAVEAMPQGGRITLKAAASSDEPRRCLIEIVDTGSGVCPEDLGKLFEPFFTTKRDRKGTGLGLSITKKIVESHGGSITLESASGQGTVARISLPPA